MLVVAKFSNYFYGDNSFIFCFNTFIRPRDLLWKFYQSWQDATSYPFPRRQRHLEIAQGKWQNWSFSCTFSWEIRRKESRFELRYAYNISKPIFIPSRDTKKSYNISVSMHNQSLFWTLERNNVQPQPNKWPKWHSLNSLNTLGLSLTILVQNYVD